MEYAALSVFVMVWIVFGLAVAAVGVALHSNPPVTATAPVDDVDPPWPAIEQPGSIRL
jgi:hypothetical protein